jgi:hypothetical protein
MQRTSYLVISQKDKVQDITIVGYLRRNRFDFASNAVNHHRHSAQALLALALLSSHPLLRLLSHVPTHHPRFFFKVTGTTPSLSSIVLIIEEANFEPPELRVRYFIGLQVRVLVSIVLHFNAIVLPAAVLKPRALLSVVLQARVLLITVL